MPRIKYVCTIFSFCISANTQSSTNSALRPFLSFFLCSFSTKESEPNSPWRLCFKLYCLLDADSISADSIEYLFLFEQVPKRRDRLCLRCERPLLS